MSRSTQHPLEIWHIPAEMDPVVLTQLTSLLSTAEQQRAQRAYSEIQRNTFISSYAAMRLILAKQLQVQPASIAYSYNAHGKPQLDNDRQLFFNLSHTHAYALLAVSPTYEIGIDIEIIKSSRDTLAIARRFFTDNEYTWLSRSDPSQRNSLFYQLWCHKEACLKAGGQGLQGGLASFSLAEQDLQHETAITDRLQKQWWVQAINVPGQYRAAIATDGPNIKPVIHHWQFSEHI